MHHATLHLNYEWPVRVSGTTERRPNCPRLRMLNLRLSWTQPENYSMLMAGRSLPHRVVQVYNRPTDLEGEYILTTKAALR